MREIIVGIFGICAGLCLLVFGLFLQLIPLVLGVYCAIWILDYFQVTNIL